VPVVVDPKFKNFFCYRGATVFKPNRRELEAALGAAVTSTRRTRSPPRSSGSASSTSC
jgi:bifunctional ADP-heptose synthase (sugar kinase/adenylyltransferase)